jgi:hypothetical protein
MLVVFVCVVCVVVVGIVGAMHTTEALNRSVARETGSAFAGDCRKAGVVWKCSVSDSQRSGGGVYRLSQGGRCWTARRTTPAYFAEAPLPARVEGCVTLRDRYPLLDSALQVGDVF